MEVIDFSCKHHILLEWEGADLRPFDEPYYEAQLIAPGTWKILSAGDHTYLVEGKDCALAIDSGYGAGNIYEYCKTLTAKPIIGIANTHDHFDHTANNCYFPKAFMSKETYELRTIPFPSFAGIDFPRDYPVEIIDEGYVFHLGGRDLETFAIRQHAVGSLAFLDRKNKIFFSGDEIVRAAITCSKTVQYCKEQVLQRFYDLRGEYDILCTGPGVFNANIVDRYLSAVDYILDGNWDKGICPEPMELPRLEKDALPGEKIIFPRREARPGDLGGGKPVVMRPQRRKLTYNNCTVVYDIDRIFDEK